MPPGGPWTRVDSHCYPGWMVSPFYDSLIAKLIVWAPDRERAIDRMQRALAEFQITGRGVKTTIPFHQRDPRRCAVPLRRRLHRLRRALHGRAGGRACRGGRLERRQEGDGRRHRHGRQGSSDRGAEPAARARGGHPQPADRDHGPPQLDAEGRRAPRHDHELGRRPARGGDELALPARRGAAGARDRGRDRRARRGRDAAAGPGRHGHRGLGRRERGAGRRRRSGHRSAVLRRHRREERLRDAQPPRRADADEGEGDRRRRGHQQARRRLRRRTTSASRPRSPTRPATAIDNARLYARLADAVVTSRMSYRL